MSTAKFRFDMSIGLPAEIDQVTEDGMLVPIQSVGSANAVYPSWEFADYDEALASSPVAFQFLQQGQVVFAGDAAPGACRDICRPTGCVAQLSTLESEHVDISPDELAPRQYQCVRCVGPDIDTGACN